MPDITRKTISATEMGGLLGVSPYVTPWMLYQRFANGMVIDSDADARMEWGQLIEPLVIKQTALKLGFEVQENRDATGFQQYVSRGLIGATRDATIWSPTDGPGALDSKCVFDYTVWMQKWEGGKRPPPMHEIQLQCQMYAGDSKAPYTWGILPVFVCGDLKLDYRRVPNMKLWELMERTVSDFFADVAAKREPDPFGKTVEIPLIKELYPLVKKKVRDYRIEKDAFEVAEKVRMMDWHGREGSMHVTEEKNLKAEMRAILLDNEEVLFPHGIILRQKPHGQGIRITAYIPDDLPQGDVSFFSNAELGG